MLSSSSANAESAVTDIATLINEIKKVRNTDFIDAEKTQAISEKFTTLFSHFQRLPSHEAALLNHIFEENLDNFTTLDNFLTDLKISLVVGFADWDKTSQSCLRLLEQFINERFKEEYKQILPADFVENNLNFNSADPSQTIVTFTGIDVYFAKRINFLQDEINRFIDCFYEMNLPIFNEKNECEYQNFLNKIKSNLADIYKTKNSPSKMILKIVQLIADCTYLEKEIVKNYSKINTADEKQVSKALAAIKKYFNVRTSALKAELELLLGQFEKMGLQKFHVKRVEDNLQKIDSLNTDLTMLFNRDDTCEKKFSGAANLITELDKTEININRILANKFKEKRNIVDFALMYINPLYDPHSNLWQRHQVHPDELEQEVKNESLVGNKI